MKALFNGTVAQFKQFTDSELKLNNWIIYDMNIYERYEIVRNNSYIEKLKELLSF